MSTQTLTLCEEQYDGLFTSKNKLLISGYSKLQLPEKIKYLCILFAFELFETKPVPFSTKFQSKKGIELTENNECASKSEYPRSSWITSDSDPVHNGIHCWRLLVDNPYQEFIRFGVGSKRAFSQDTAYGIAYDTKSNRNHWKPSGNINQRNKINLKHFAQRKCAVDMLLDADQGILKLCVVGMCNDEHEAKIWGMATTKLGQRWVPYFTFGSTSNNITLRVMQIANNNYGYDMNNIKSLIAVEKYYDCAAKHTPYPMDHVHKPIEKKESTFTFQFCGIQPPKTHKITSKTITIGTLHIDSCITVTSSLTKSDTIYSLKHLVRETYNISFTTGIVILYANQIISCDDALTLNDCAVTDGSLLLLGIVNYSYLIKVGWTCNRCTYLNAYDRKKCEMCDQSAKSAAITVRKASNPCLYSVAPYTYNKKEKKIKQKNIKSISDEIKPIKGFDIITQELDVDVYEMHQCHHVMSKQSLFDYVLTTLKDDNNLHVKCPHPNEEIKSDDWSCLFCTYVNDIDRNTCEMCANTRPKTKKYCETKWDYTSIKQVLSSTDYDFETYKLELLSARNKIQKDCDVQKCPTCNTLYYRNSDTDKLCWEDIQCVETINQHFKTKCVVCDADDDNTVESKDIDEPSTVPVSKLMIQAKGNRFGSLPFGFEKPLKWKAVNDECSVNVQYDEQSYFCWGCGQSWEYGHICDSSFKKDLVRILLNAETKKIGSVSGVPCIRCCPKCCQLITHSEACKHMSCGTCKLDFCFVCLKRKKNGNWQCGSHSDVCKVAPPQNMEALPNTIVLNKNTFKLF